MARLLYISNARIPTPLAHGLQIMQNCEAFADQGLSVTLWCARRKPLAGVPQDDAWAFYGVKPNFNLRRLPCIDLTGLSEKGTTTLFGKLLFFLQLGTFALSALIGVLFSQADIYYSRDPLTLFLLSLVKPREKLVYESHRLNQPGRGAWLQRQVLSRVGATVAVTPPLRDGLAKRQEGVKHPSRLIVAHDGIRKARFDGMPSQSEARQQIGWPQDLFIVGYVGRLQTMGLDKGVNVVIDAIAQMKQRDSVAIALVGGPDDQAEICRQRWINHGLPESRFLYAGHVAADQVPRYLSAFDVCTMPLPWTEHFAYYASPIKLFEYMASGRALVATDLPSWADVVTDGENALLIPPSDATAFAAALERLQNDPQLRQRIASNACERVMEHYTWEARAKAIIQHVRQS